MNLNFKINEDYLATHTLASMDESKFSSKTFKRDIVNFQNYAWRESPVLYNFIIGKSNAEIALNYDLNIIGSKVNKFLSSLKKSREFQKILSQTREYSLTCSRQWKNNLNKTSKIINDITGLKLSKKFNVYLTHPSLKNGKYIAKNSIAWGHHENYKNYTTIYLWHEILHSYFDLNDLNHAIIQLVTDNELRLKLNGTKYPPFEGHKDLQNLMSKIVPYWRKYLTTK